MNVKRAIFKVIYNGTNITEDVSRHLISMTYTDNVHGKSDEIELVLDDAGAQWRNEWYPQKGDRVNVKLGYENDLLNCGDFFVDEIELSGPPSTIHLRGLSAPVSKSLRTKTSKAREGKSLKQIAQEIANKHGLTINEGTQNVKTQAKETDSYIATIDMIRGQLFYALDQDFDTQASTLNSIVMDCGTLGKDLKNAGFIQQGDEVINGFRKVIKNINKAGLSVYNTTLLTVRNFLSRVNNKALTKSIPLDLSSIVIERSTQNRETDLAYLRRISADHGFAFTIKGTILVFHSVYHLEEQPVVTTISRNQVSHYSLKDKTHGTYKAAKLKHHNPKKSSVTESNINVQPLINKDGLEFVQIMPEDTLEVRAKAETQQQADAKVKAHLHKHNSKTCNGNITLPGKTSMVAGINFGLIDMGKFSGTYHVEKSTHTYERGGGYVTDVEIKRVGAPTKSDQKIKPAKIASGQFRVQTIINRDGLPFVQIVQ